MAVAFIVLAVNHDYLLDWPVNVDDFFNYLLDGYLAGEEPIDPRAVKVEIPPRGVLP
jgi:hypothetical protein